MELKITRVKNETPATQFQFGDLVRHEDGWNGVVKKSISIDHYGLSRKQRRLSRVSEKHHPHLPPPAATRADARTAAAHPGANCGDSGEDWSGGLL